MDSWIDRWTGGIQGSLQAEGAWTALECKHTLGRVPGRSIPTPLGSAVGKEEMELQRTCQLGIGDSGYSVINGVCPFPAEGREQQ